MKKAIIENAIFEAERFIERARIVMEENKYESGLLKDEIFGGTRSMGDMKRSSLDLGRALVKIRKTSYDNQ